MGSVTKPSKTVQRQAVSFTRKGNFTVTLPDDVNNHCHAINILYHEVLAHYVVETRLADVQECLFVPLQIQPFDYATVARYRDILERFCRLPLGHPIRRGFAAIDRIQSGVDFMGAKNDTVVKIKGELVFTFTLQRPADKPNTSTATGAPATVYNDTAWDVYLPYMLPDINTTTLAAEWNASTDRRQYFDTKVAPIIVQNFVARLSLSINKPTGGADVLTKLPQLELKLMQQYVRGNALTVKIVQTGSLANLGINMAVPFKHLVLKVEEDIASLNLHTLLSVKLKSAFVAYDTARYKDNIIISSADSHKLIADEAYDGLLNDAGTYRENIMVSTSAYILRDLYTHHIPVDATLLTANATGSNPDDATTIGLNGEIIGEDDPVIVLQPTQLDQAYARKLVSRSLQAAE